MKRQRGRGRKPGGGGHHNHQQHPNRQMESNGPEAKVRGPASHIHERYLQLARDAASSGDRVLSENYLQHADHYFRLWRQMQPAAPPQPTERFPNEPEFEGEEEGAAEAEAGEEGEAAAEASEQPDVEFPHGEQPRFERGEGEGRRRRGRRNRFRPGGEDGDGGGEERRAEGGEARRERGEGEGRRERGEGEGRRERRERGDGDREQAGPEGFSNGPRPAFLRGD